MNKRQVIENEDVSLGAQAQYLTFKVIDEDFGIDILSVKEILEFYEITEIPLVPKYIKGVLNLRGNVIPVIDLSARFGWNKSLIKKTSCIIITEVTDGKDLIEIGILVDSVTEVTTLHQTDIDPPPNFGSNIRLDFVKNIGKIDNRFILLLEINTVLSIEELSHLKDADDYELEDTISTSTEIESEASK